MAGRLVRLFVAFLVLTFALGANAVELHCQPFSTSSNQICVNIEGSSGRIYFQHADGVSTLIDEGPIRFLNWSRAPGLRGEETAPAGIPNFSPLAQSPRTSAAQGAAAGEYPIWHFLAGIGDHVLWVRDNGILAKFPFNPTKIKRVDYSSPNSPSLPGIGTDHLKQQLENDHFEVFTFVSHANGTFGKDDQAEHFLVRYSDGKFLHLGPFPNKIRKKELLMRDYDHLTTQGIVQLCLRQEVGLGWLKYEFDLDTFQAQLEIQKNLPRKFPQVVAAERTPQVVPEAQIESAPGLSDSQHLASLALLSEPSAPATRQKNSADMQQGSSKYRVLEYDRLEVLENSSPEKDLLDTLDRVPTTVAQLILENPLPNRLSVNDLAGVAFSGNPALVRSALKGLAQISTENSVAAAKRHWVIRELINSPTAEIRAIASAAAKECGYLLSVNPPRQPL